MNKFVRRSALVAALCVAPAGATLATVAGGAGPSAEALAGVGLATATFKLAETKPVTGVVDLSNLTVTATSTFNVLITSVNPLGLPINLVGNSCGTSKPVSVTFSGKFSFGGSSSFSGSYKIPQLSNCGALTAALNLVIPGPGNQFNASFAPA